MWCEVPQGVAPPNALAVHIVPAGDSPPAPGPLSLGAVAYTDLDLTTVTGATINVRKPDGTVVTWSATYTAATPLAVTGATNASPIVLTVPSTLGIGETVTVASVGGNTAANGDWFAQVLTPTTVALYQDAQFLLPSTGNAPYTSGGTCTPNDLATVTHAFAAPTGSSPYGDCDQIGPYSLAVELSVTGGTVPCKGVVLQVVSDYATS